MLNIKPLPERYLDELVAQEPGHVGLKAMRLEIERMADAVSDCWLLLDDVARSCCDMDLRRKAQKLLREQKAPGWKS